MRGGTGYGLNNQVYISFMLYLCIIHAVSGLFYMIEAKNSAILRSFEWQFYLLLLTSLLLALFTYTLFSKAGKNYVVLFIIQWISLLILGYPLGTDLFIETTLTSGLLLQIVLIREDVRRSLPLSLIVLLFFVLMQHNTRYNGFPIAKPKILPIFMQVLLLTTLSGVTAWLKNLFVKTNAKTQEIEELKSASARLIKANRSIQEYAYNIEKQSIDQERTRLSRELHDIIGYTMVSISMMMEDAIDRHIREDYEQIFPIIINSRDLSRNSHQEIRDALIKFRNEKKQKRPFLNELLYMTQIFSEASGVHVDLTAPQKLPALSQEYGYQIMRIIQEGLTNALHHGKADNIKILLVKTQTGISILIEDDGVGAEIIQEGIGISGMRERLKIMNGDIDIDHKRNCFRLKISIPIESQENG